MVWGGYFSWGGGSHIQFMADWTNHSRMIQLDQLTYPYMDPTATFSLARARIKSAMNEL